MSSELFPPIPADTARTALAVFGRRNFYLATGDRLNSLFSGLIQEGTNGWIFKPSRTQGLLYLITIFQFLETLPDDLAADALHLRVDWKYALHLPLDSPALEGVRFCEFRRWLLADAMGTQLLEALLERMSDPLLAIGKLYTHPPAGEVVRNVCLVSRLAMVWVSIRDVLGLLATRQPEWLSQVNLPHWYDRYGRDWKTIDLAVGVPEQEALAQSIGADGDYLLRAISRSPDLHLAASPEIQAMKQTWRDQYHWLEGKITWRKEVCAYCSLPVLINEFDLG